MKKILIILALFAYTSNIAQIKNEAEIETVKKVKTTDAEGVEVQTKEITTKVDQKMALVNLHDTHNFNTVMMPREISTNVDYYNDGTKYQFKPSDTGYYIVKASDTSNKLARLYPTSQKGYYLYTMNGNTSMGYFNSDGDFVVESYDPDGDGVMNYVYKIKMDEDTKKKMNKMK